MKAPCNKAGSLLDSYCTQARNLFILLPTAQCLCLFLTRFTSNKSAGTSSRHSSFPRYFTFDWCICGRGLEKCNPGHNWTAQSSFTAYNPLIRGCMFVEWQPFCLKRGASCPRDCITITCSTWTVTLMKSRKSVLHAASGKKQSKLRRKTKKTCLGGPVQEHYCRKCLGNCEIGAT